MTEIKPVVGMSFMPGEITVAAMPEEAWNYDEATLTLPAGRYFVGDPCYTAGDDRKAWLEWCKISHATGFEGISAGTYNGLPVVGLRTYFGDGTFRDQFGNSYDVDSGTIGVVPDELITKMSLSEEASIGTLLQTTGHWIDFEEDFTVSRSDDGLLAIGRIFIDT